jgi:hypothetical protein
MKNGFLKWMALGVAVVSLCASSAMAATCTSWNLATAVATSGTNQVLTGSANDPCTDYGLTFSNFSVFIGTGFAGTPFSITATFNPNGVISFNSNEVAGQDIDVEFKITPGITLMILSSSSGAGTGVTETVCSVQIPLPPGSCGGSGGTTLGSGSVVGSNATEFAITPAAFDWVFKDVSGTSGFAEQVVPEPVSTSLIGAGLLVIGLVARKRRK